MIKFNLYSADWCSSCHTLEHTLEVLKEDGILDFKAISVDSEDGCNAVEEYGIKNIPFVVVEYPDGSTKTFAGTRTASELKDMVNG